MTNCNRFLCGLALFSAAAFSLQAHAAVPTGTYLGGELGFTDNTMRFDVQGASNGERKVDNTGFLGGLYAGYNMTFSHHLYFAVELFAHASTLSGINDAVANLSVRSVSVINDYGGALIQGFTLGKHTWIYGRVGILSGMLRSGVTLLAGGNPDLYKRRALGWQAGAGIGYAILKNTTMRLQYTYARYPSKQYQYIPGNVTNILHPWTQQVTLGMAYTFN